MRKSTCRCGWWARSQKRAHPPVPATPRPRTRRSGRRWRRAIPTRPRKPWRRTLRARWAARRPAHPSRSRRARQRARPLAMKILFLGQLNNLEPWFNDVVTAVGEADQVILWDPDAPFGPQIRDSQEIVDQGGSVATRAMLDACAGAEVKLCQ